MAIKNATDLLVYKKTSPAQPQITRIKVKNSTPFKDFTSGENIIMNNITDASGDISDGVTGNITTNTATGVLSAISSRLVGIDNYTASATITDGAFKYIDFTNGADGPVPTLEVLSGTAEFKAGAVEIIVLQSGQSLVYQPIAYSTSASISMNTDLRDITTKDSEGWQENVAGVRSFEMSTDALWDVNNAVGVESAVNDLVSGDSVDIKFSDRVRNLVDTEEVYGSSEWLISNTQNITKHLEDPFGQFTAAELAISSSTGFSAHIYKAPIQLVEGKKVTWSLYLKAFSATADDCSLRIRSVTTSAGNDINSSIKIISGSGTVTSLDSAIKKITGLSTSSWTRVQLSSDSVISGTDLDAVQFYLYPGDDYTTQTTADKVITASWQVETGIDASDYQNPTEVDCYQGKAFVNSVSIDAGTEENATYSASFTGTSELFVNGLGHELIGDPYFDDGTNWWSANGAATISNGAARILWSSGTVSEITTPSIMTTGEKYCLEYIVSNNTSGGIVIPSLAGQPEQELPVTVGSHKIYFTASGSSFYIKRDGVTDISLTYASLKQVFS
jgi:hypothetical protein